MGYRSNYFDKNDAPKDLFGATKREVKSYAGYYSSKSPLPSGTSTM